MNENQSTAPDDRNTNVPYMDNTLEIENFDLNAVELITEIQGKHGIIRILKQNRDMTEVDEDIHALIARILLKKEKRLALGREHPA
ncbi:MAG: hypothetical protein WD469_07270 [Paenibacillaceae bacterium]